MAYIYEIPLYRFRKGLSFEEARQAALDLNEFLKTAPGFKVRRTYYDRKADIWIDVAEWETMEHAMQGLEGFAKSESFGRFMKLADPGFNLMHHAELIDVFAA